MGLKKLVWFFNGSDGNEAIAETDYARSFKAISLLPMDPNRLQVTEVLCTSAGRFVSKLREYLRDPSVDQLFLHFSGHGDAPGIPYNEWLLDNASFAELVDNAKVRMCFFSSCKAEELVRLVNERDIPVVIGTAANDLQNKYAITFQRAFYESLVEGKTIPAAYQTGLIAANAESGQNLVSEPVILRGQGAGDRLAQVNKLQCVLADKRYASLRLNPNLEQEMREAGFERPFVLNWFQDPVAGQAFGRAFRDKFDDRLTYLRIPDDQLDALDLLKPSSVLDERHAPDDTYDPFVSSDITLVLHCDENLELPVPIRNHLTGEGVEGLIEHRLFDFDNYRVIMNLKPGIDKDILVKNPGVAEKITAFRYRDTPSDTLGNDAFIRQIDRQLIDFSKRKEITLNFTYTPHKGALIEVPSEHKTVRFFFANNINEYLINFLIRWIILRDRYTAPVIQLDNIVDPDMDFLDALNKELAKGAAQQGLAFYLIQKFPEGLIIVMRNRSDDIQASKAIIDQLVTEADTAAMIAQNVSRPSLIFFLHDSNEQIALPERDRIHVRNLTEAIPVNNEMLERWCKLYPFDEYAADPTMKVIHDSVVRVSASIKDKLDNQQYQGPCPSEVICDICDQFALPHKQIIRL
ncbi:MAG: hypothetical protein R3301_09530 [Saprospiraceae bacterium]|nr:hypothetical protein [Saprospiraceae bacterium]